MTSLQGKNLKDTIVYGDFYFKEDGTIDFKECENGKYRLIKYHKSGAIVSNR